MNRADAGCAVVSLSEKPEPPRMRLADMWPEEGLGALAENPPEAPRRIVKAPAERQPCALCQGDVMRSRVRFYERLWVIWSKMRPYRCMECGVRQWRPETKT
jgi:hypothetical protein